MSRSSISIRRRWGRLSRNDHRDDSLNINNLRILRPRHRPPRHDDRPHDRYQDKQSHFIICYINKSKLSISSSVPLLHRIVKSLDGYQ